MTYKITQILTYLIILLPLTLITGPAIPDITITLSGLFFIFLFILKKKYKVLLNNNFFLVTIFFWFYLILISFFAENKLLSFQEALIFIRLLFIPIFLIYFIFDTNKNIEKILLIIFSGIIFVTIDTIFQYSQYDSEFGFGKDLLGFESNWYGRLTGPFGNELIPGAYLSRFSFLGLAFLLYKFKNNKYLNLYILFYLSLVGLAIFASGERMAFATFSLGLFFILIFFSNKRIILTISIILISFTIVLVQKIHPSYNDFKILESTPLHLGLKVEKEFNCKNDLNIKCKKIINLQPSFFKILENFNLSAYGEIYKLSLAMYKDHKIFGIGMNNFTFLCKTDSRYNKIMNNYVCVSHPHNIYIQWLVETGIFGIFIFIIYILNIFINIIKKNYNEYSIISISTILVLFWPIMSTGSLLKNWNGISTFLIIGICLILPKLKKYN